MMGVYLEDIPLPEAQHRLAEALKKADLRRVLGEETIPLDERAVGRVTARPVWAKLSSPHYHSSAMDGFAVRASATEGASETNPVTISLEDAAYVDTGDPLPDQTNAVIPIELVEPLDGRGEPAQDPRAPAAIRIRVSLPPWKNVRPMGEDMVTSQLVLPSGHVIRPVDLGGAAGSGHDTITVARKPRVAVIPTGTELVAPGSRAQPGEIIEYNSLVLAGQIQEWGGSPDRHPITPDDYQLLRERVKTAAEDHDLVLVIAGSSAGSEDYTAAVVDELGELLVHGVAVRPGHPVILGMIGGERSTPVIGVPGFPVSAALTGEIFMEPLLARWTGRPPRRPEKISATLTRKITSPAGDDDYVRVAVGKVGDRTIAAPLSRGSGVITSLVRADGIMIIPRGSQGYPAGEAVEVQLYRPRRTLDQTIFAIGSHDLTLDLMAQYLSRADRRLSSANVGSLGGLIALKRGHAHLAGAHLLDPESGEYNISYIKQHLPDLPVRLITLVHRTQGLILKPGNPKSIGSLEDLARDDVSLINRQRGAGTRLLLDYHLQQLGVPAEEISGYDQEEFTHLTAAAAVLSGRADAALGIEPAARALEMDFIPLFEERYDLVMPSVYLKGPDLKPVLDLLEDPDFRRTVDAIAGYDAGSMGETAAELG